MPQKPSCSHLFARPARTSARITQICEMAFVENIMRTSGERERERERERACVCCVHLFVSEEKKRQFCLITVEQELSSRFLNLFAKIIPTKLEFIE